MYEIIDFANIVKSSTNQALKWKMQGSDHKVIQDDKEHDVSTYIRQQCLLTSGFMSLVFSTLGSASGHTMRVKGSRERSSY